MAKYVIEVASSSNNNLIFAPNKETLRGRWSPQAVAHLDPKEMMKRIHREVGEIPGECIMVDTESYVGRFEDPLAVTPGGKEKWEKMSKIFESNQVSFGGPKKLSPTREFQLDVDSVKEWLYEMRRCVDGQKAEVFAGSDPMPTLEEIAKMPGKRRKDPFRDLPGDEEKRYVDIVRPKPSDRAKPVAAE